VLHIQDLEWQQKWLGWTSGSH